MVFLKKIYLNILLEIWYPSTAETNHCLVLVPGSKIHVGIKILTFGFSGISLHQHIQKAD